MCTVLERRPACVQMTGLSCYEQPEPQSPSVGCFPGHGENGLFSSYQHI